VLILDLVGNTEGIPREISTSPGEGCYWGNDCLARCGVRLLMSDCGELGTIAMPKRHHFDLD